MERNERTATEQVLHAIQTVRRQREQQHFLPLLYIIEREGDYPTSL